MIGPRVIAEVAAHGARILHRIVASDARMPGGGEQQRGKNFQQRGLAGAIRAQQRYRFSAAHFQRNSRERERRGAFERLEVRAPAAARRRKKLLHLVNANGADGAYRTGGRLRHRRFIAFLCGENNVRGCRAFPLEY